MNRATAAGTGPGRARRPRSWNGRIRQTHRWTSLAFTGVVLIVTFATLGSDEPAEWVYLMPLLPLAVLGFTGLYLFVQPYATRWRGARRTTE